MPLYRVWERVFSPFGAYRKFFDPQLEPILGDDEVALVAINTSFNWTTTEGRVRPEQLDRAIDAFSRVPAGAYRIAVLHHHLLPPPTGRAKRVVRGAAAVIQGLSEVGVDLVLAGHLHRSFMARVPLASDPQDPGLLVLHVGTTTSSRGRYEEEGRNTAHWLQVGPAGVELASLIWRDGDFEIRKRESLPRRPDERRG